MKNRKLVFLTIISVFFIFHNLFAQNIPHANFNGPWDVKVNTYNGNLYLQNNLLSIPNQSLFIDLGLAYNSFRDTLDIGFGKGWTSSYSMYYDTISTDTMFVEHADGRKDIFVKESNAYKATPGIFDRWEEYESGKFRLTTKYGKRYYFDNPSHQNLTRSEDTNGNEISLTYTGNEWTGISDGSGRSLSLVWSGGHLQSINDANAASPRSVNMAYSDSLLYSITDPEGGTINYSYNGLSTLYHIVNEKGDEMDINFDQEGRVVRLATCIAHITFTYNSEQGKTYVTEKNNTGDRITTYIYDEEGKLIQKAGSCCGYNTQYQYDGDNNVSVLTDGNSNPSMANHDARGNALFTTDAEGAGQSFTFDNTLNRLNGLADKKGNATSFEYDALGNLQKMIQPEGATIEMTYDAEGNIQSLTDGNGNLTNLEYNTFNDVTAIKYPIGSESFEYDNVGNLLLSKDGNDNGVSYEYDGLNRLLSTMDDLGNTIRYEYDPASNLEKETDPNGIERQFTYDSHHRLETVTTPAGLTQYGYDASDNLTSITDANQHTTQFAFDQRDLVVEEKDPLGKATNFTYDGNGNMLSRTDANGDLTYYTYDKLNRMLSKSYEGNTDNYSYDAAGNLIHCSNNNISMSYAYDGLNRLISKTTDNWGQTIAYEYDNVGNRIKMTDPTGTTNYEYDANNRLVKITNPAGEITALSYDPGGRLLRLDQHNGTYTLYGYDRADRLTSLVHQNASGEVLDSYSYTYDGNGNRLTMTTPEGTATYTYDGNNRMLSAKYNGILATDENYQYDGAGNRIDLNGTAYLYDEADRLQSHGSVVYDYDNNGNLLMKNDNGEETRYFYDGENQLIKVELPDGSTVEFQYDPFGNRIRSNRATGATRYLLDGDNVLLELDAGGNALARYTSALTMDSWISMQRNGQSYYYHSDGLGSITALTDASQSNAKEYDYDAYGNILSQTGAVENPYSYTGREWDAETGLYYYRSRFYDAVVGRFLTKDLEFGNLLRPSSFNRYTYVEGNPVSFKDPTGEELVTATVIAIGLGLVTAIDYGYQAIANHIEFGWDITCWKVDVFGVVTNKITGVLKAFSLKRVNQTIGMFERSIKGLQKKFRASIHQKGGYDYKIVDRINKQKKVLEQLKLEKKGLEKKNAYGEVLLEAENKGAGFFGFEVPKVSIRDCRNEGGSQEKEKSPPSIPLPQPKPPVPGDGSVEVPIVRAIDPNEIIAPDGCDIQNWIAQKATLPYTILYENDPDFATAPAQTVRIEHTFDSDINPFAFRLGDFGFGNYYFEVPDNVSFYNTQIDLSDSLGVLLAVTAGLDIDRNQIFWIFESRDPATNQAANLPADAGYLPVNDSLTHAGEGFVNFTVKANSNSTTSDTIHARANIIFDDNLPIHTNLAFNLIDADAPVSEITAIDSLGGGRYDLTWTGSDNGAGISAYLLYVSTNQEPFLPIADNLVGNTFRFEGEAGNTYRFFTLAVDCTGNREALKNQGEGDCALLVETALIQPTGMDANGSIAITVSGGLGDLTYDWFPNVSSTSSATDIPANTYAVTITDERGCSVEIEIELDSIPVGVAEILGEKGLFIHQLFPVPTSTEINIVYTSPEQVLWLEVFHTDGKKMLGKTVNAQIGKSNQERLDVSDWAAGSYLVRLQTVQRQVSAVFVKQ